LFYIFLFYIHIIFLHKKNIFYIKYKKCKNKCINYYIYISFHFYQATPYIKLTSTFISHHADIIAKNPIIHHLTISFHFLIFSSSHTLIVNINAQYTIDHTAIIERKILIFVTHPITLSLNHQLSIL